MTEKEIAVNLYVEILKYARDNKVMMSIDDYKAMSKEAILQAKTFLDVYRLVDIPDDILNIP